MGKTNKANTTDRHGLQRWLDSDANRRKALEIRRAKLEEEAKRIDRRSSGGGGGGAGRR